MSKDRITISHENRVKVEDLKLRSKILQERREELVKAIMTEHLQSTYDAFIAEWEKNGPSQEARRLCSELNLAISGASHLVYEQIGYVI